MTTDIRVQSALDLFVKNDVFNISRVNSKETTSVAGMCWATAKASPSEPMLTILNTYLECVRVVLPDYETWLLIGSSAWQSKTRVIRHYGLWGALRARGFRVPSDSKSAVDIEIESADGLKFFGAEKISSFLNEDIVKILLNERCAYVISLPAGISPRAWVDIGWLGDLSRDYQMIWLAADSNALLAKKSGEFDDGELGLIVIGQSSAIKKLVAIA
jgi:hypothetical protein